MSQAGHAITQPGEVRYAGLPMIRLADMFPLCSNEKILQV